MIILPPTSIPTAYLEKKGSKITWKAVLIGSAVILLIFLLAFGLRWYNLRKKKQADEQTVQMSQNPLQEAPQRQRQRQRQTQTPIVHKPTAPPMAMRVSEADSIGSAYDHVADASYITTESSTVVPIVNVEMVNKSWI